jgi:hypothetical protein
MTADISGFINTWTPSFYSINERIQVRNITQGGNHTLSALPQGLQTMWAGSIMAEVAAVTAGPLYAIAQLFRALFHPVISLPLSIGSCLVKERFYESSVHSQVVEQTKYYRFELAAQPSPVPGTVSILVEGEIRHFTLGRNCDWDMMDTIEAEVEGRRGRFYFRELRNEEPFTENCREIELDGQRVRVLLESKYELPFVKIEIGEISHSYHLEKEVPQAIQGTFSFGNGLHYQLTEILQQEPNCLQLKVPPQEFHYETGAEIDAPTENSRSFSINGQLKHFSSAKFCDRPVMGVSGVLNRIPYLPIEFPTRLNRFTVEVLEFVSQHMSHIARMALVVAGAVFAYFGHLNMAFGTLLPVSYEYLNHELGWIPRKVSLFMEEWLPVISMVGLLLVGSFSSQVIAATTLASMIPSVNLWLHQKVAKGVRAVFFEAGEQIVTAFFDGMRRERYRDIVEKGKKYPALEKCDAPLSKKEFNAEEIRAILDEENNEIDTAHLTKDYKLPLNFEKNFNFDELMRLWDEVGARWSDPNHYSLLLKKAVDDKRFILFIQNRFPEAKRFFYQENWRLNRADQLQEERELRIAHRQQFDAWIGILAEENGSPSKQEYLAHWAREQLQCYIGKIEGTRPIEGEQRLLKGAIENTAMILPFLLKPETDAITKEDVLLNLAIEGGDYCALGMRRASYASLQTFIEPNRVYGDDPQLAFENEVLFTLQKQREWYIERGFQYFIQKFSKHEQLQDSAPDVHLNSALSRVFKRGFSPLDEEEMKEFSLTELVINQSIGLYFQALMLEKYPQDIPGIIHRLQIVPGNVRRNRVLEYLRAWVQGNQRLSNEEKEDLLEGALLNDDEHLADAENYPKWNRLMLRILGVLKEKEREPAPCSLGGGSRLDCSYFLTRAASFFKEASGS